MPLSSRQLHVHLHFDGLRGNNKTPRRILTGVLDAGFYMLMAAAVMSSLCLFLSLYSSDLDPNAQSYRASVIRQTSRIKNLFRHDPMEDMKRELAMLDREQETAARQSFQNSSSTRTRSQFRKFVIGLKNVTVQVVMARNRLKANGGKDFFSCGGSTVVKFPGIRQMKLAMLQLPERLPDVDPFPSQSFKTCAVVGNSGSLLENEFGPEIDEHDAVFRFNAARIVGFEQFVGSKTAIRILNSPDAIFPKDGEEATLTTLRTNDHLQSWSKMMEKHHMGAGQAYMADPEFLCHTWDWVQRTGDKPSSGLVGVVMAIRLCQKVNLYGFQSSNYFGRFTRPHYYDWERPKKGREKVHPFAREVWLYQQLDKFGYIKIHG